MNRLRSRRKALLRGFCTPEGALFCRCIVLSDDDYLQRMKEDNGQEYISGDMLRLHLTKREWDRFYRQWRRWMHAQFPFLSERRQSVGGSPSGAIRSVGDRPLVRRRQSVGGSPSKSYVHPCERSRSGAIQRRPAYSICFWCFQLCMTPDILCYIQECLRFNPTPQPQFRWSPCATRCNILHQLFQYFHLT